jgi:two-component system nitrate/nitrite response regulator NarL
MITILIIDDHPLVTDGIKTMLQHEQYLQVSGTAKTAKEALAFLAHQQVDIILLDISLPDMDGLKLCELIRKHNKTAKIIGVTSANDAGIITQLLHRGGNGYLLKNMERDELIHAINSVLDGHVYVSKEANEKVLQHYQSLDTALGQMPVLTRREKEIIELLSDGLTSPQIANKLFLSVYTIETHRKNLLQKFNVSSTLLLLKVAREYKLLN